MSVNNGLRKVLIIMWATETSLMLDTFVGIFYNNDCYVVSIVNAQRIHFQLFAYN